MIVIGETPERNIFHNKTQFLTKVIWNIFGVDKK